ncbi:MAG: hypothetical protein R2795_03260 [Saprospiraceae bacterium]
MQKADDIAQDLFDVCFEITRGPDAPDVDWIELDREIVAVFSNDTSLLTTLSKLMKKKVWVFLME